MLSGIVCCMNPDLDNKLWHSPHCYYDTPELTVPSYGVCDSLEDVFKRCPLIKESPHREFLIVSMPILREDEPEEGGWRWCKWGPYLGNKTPKAEYLHDEPEIDMVIVYSIYERRTPASELLLASKPGIVPFVKELLNSFDGDDSDIDTAEQQSVDRMKSIAATVINLRTKDTNDES